MALLSKPCHKSKTSVFPKQCANAFWPACRNAPSRTKRKQRCMLHNRSMERDLEPVSDSAREAFQDFVFVANTSQTRPMNMNIASVSQMCGEAVLGTLMAVSSAKVSLASSPSVLACVPIIVPFTTPFEVEDGFWVLSDRALKIQRMLITVAFLQGTLALSRALLGDVWGGAIGIGMASMGFYSCTPSGIRWLPTYTVATFINGTMNLLLLAEATSATKGALLTLAQPSMMNFVNALVISAPVVSLTGVVCSYHFLKELRRLASTGRAADSAADRSSAEGQANVAQHRGPGPWQPFAGEGHRIQPLPVQREQGPIIYEAESG